MEQPELERELLALAERVAVIEKRLDMVAAGAAAQPAVPEPGPPDAHRTDPTEVFPALGRALLGLAGAYLLRALAESGIVPSAAGVAVGILYAMLWLVWAARTPADRRIQAAVHSLTAVLVIAPLVWEATLRFHTVSTWTAAATLLLFMIFGLAVSWRRNLLIVATIVTLAGLGTCGALLVATYDVLPFTFVFLAVAAAVEVSACLEHWLSERWLAAAAADLSVLLATWLVTREHGLPEGYAPIPHGWLLGAQAALLGIYLASIIVRTLLRHCTFTKFETAQCATAFLISVGGGLRLSTAMAIPAVVCGAACYIVSFALLERQGRGRNFYSYSTFGLLLALAGSRILLSGDAAAGLWAVAAILCLWSGGRFRSLTLRVHGGIFLVLALASSGALRQAVAYLLGEASWPGKVPLAVCAGVLTAGLAYLLATRQASGDGQTWNFQVFRLAIAAPLALIAAGILAGTLTATYHVIFGAEASHDYCATLRTGVLAAGALGLGWAGRRWNCLEAWRLKYPCMALGAYRLVAVDLHRTTKAALFLSLLMYGAALILLPRLRSSATTAE